MRPPAGIAATALRTATASLCAVIALGLTACDTVFARQRDPAPFARLSGPEVVNKALAATRAAKAVHITVGTKSPDGAPVQAYVATDIRGECMVTLSMGAAGTMELVRTGGTVYVQSDEAMLRAADAGRSRTAVDTEVKKLTGRWVKARPFDRYTARALSYCDRKAFLDRLAGNSATAHKGRAITVGSTPALSLTGTAGRGTWTAAVATEGRPHILKLGFSTETPVTVEFSEFDKPFTVKKPAV
ncbi:hypothetical protein [Streptomyces sp. NPDC048411]|uniref:hypothetical protein n=1 Tax=Streptomyces sp. NPDC048411 TaxID=3157206 RepID=UPI0034521F0A